MHPIIPQDYSESNIFIPSAIIPPVQPVTTAIYCSPSLHRATVETIPSTIIANSICGFILLRKSPNSLLRSGGIQLGLTIIISVPGGYAEGNMKNPRIAQLFFCCFFYSFLNNGLNLPHSSTPPSLFSDFNPRPRLFLCRKFPGTLLSTFCCIGNSWHFNLLLYIN